MLPNADRLASGYVQDAISEIDALPIPKPLPWAILLKEKKLKTEIAQIGHRYFTDGIAAKSSFVRVPKKQYSFRMHARLTLASQIAFELSAREFATHTDISNSHCMSLSFDSTLPERLFPEKKASDRQRWRAFDEKRISLIRRIGPADQNGLSGFTTDLSRYFDNIRQDKLIASMYLRYPRMRGRVDSFKVLLSQIMGERDGLPQCAQTGFFFGDIFLLGADSVASKDVGEFIRWADEFWWFDKYPSKVESAYRSTLAAISDLGLVFNDSKSKHVNREEELAEDEIFSVIRESFYRDFSSKSTKEKCGFICGMIIERSLSGKPASRMDRFLLNRLRELFVTDRPNASDSEKLVLRAFSVSYERSKDALGDWCEILLFLPNRAAVYGLVYDAFKKGKYPLDSDKARLLDILAEDDFAGESESNMKSSTLERMMKNENSCATLRGSALRVLFCRTRDSGLAVELARNSGDSRLLREYIAATAILGDCSHCKEILNELTKHAIDEEESIFLQAYRLLCNCRDQGERKNRMLPSDPFILTKQLELAVRQKY